MAKGYCKHIRAGKTYRFEAAGMDRYDRHPGTPVEGAVVRVVKSPRGTPPMGTMGHCYVEDLAGKFLGLVLCSSLKPVKVRQVEGGYWSLVGRDYDWVKKGKKR